MSKKILSVFTMLAAVAIPTVALADKYTATVETKNGDHKAQVTTPNITTARGSEDPTRTDVGHLSRHNDRDFVKDPTGWSAGASIGTGLGEAYGLGFGGRAGYTLPGRVYVGGIVGYHVGTTTETEGSSISSRTWYFGPEAGYDLGVGKVLVRPVLGLGLGFKRETMSAANEATASATNVYVAPGASVIYPIGNFFVGGDSRALLMKDNNTITFMGTAGAHL